MRLDTLCWIILATLALALELFGLFHGEGFRPLTWIIRGEMTRSTMFAGALAAFLFWLIFHLIVQTYLPHGHVK